MNWDQPTTQTYAYVLVVKVNIANTPLCLFASIYQVRYIHYRKKTKVSIVLRKSVHVVPITTKKYRDV